MTEQYCISCLVSCSFCQCGVSINAASTSTVIVTVPHSKCVQDCDQGPRTCDCVALKRATQLRRRLEAENISVSFFPSDAYRYQIDYNRFPARDSAYRERVRNAFPGAKMLLDIHSYPLKTSTWGQHPMILLHDASPFPGYARDLSRKTKAPLFKGKNNDIIDEANKNGLPAILIEFNESSTIGVNADLMTIVAWVKTEISFK